MELQGFDTLEATRTLESAGMESAPAEAVVQVVKAGAQGLATNADMGAVRSDIRVMKSDISDLKSDVVVLKADVADLKSDVVVLKADVADLKSDVVVLKSDVADLKSDVVVLKSDVAAVKSEIALLEARMDAKLKALETRLTNRLYLGFGILFAALMAVRFFP